MKQHFIIIDTETTMGGKVADFGAVICDRNGNVVNQCGILLNGIYNNRDDDPLFHDKNAGELWGFDRLDSRYSEYDDMLDNGSRMLASVPALNNWLAKAAISYKPILTAYNIAFDRDKCLKTGIDLTLFDRSFCLWHTAAKTWAHSKEYRNFVAECHAFNNVTKHGNMTYKTNAETMARFVLGQPELEDEPHTALEDALFYELPILRKMLKKFSTRKILDMECGYNWRDYIVKDWFTAR